MQKNSGILSGFAAVAAIFSLFPLILILTGCPEESVEHILPDFDLTDVVNPPIFGRPPSSGFGNSRYDVAVAWKNEDNTVITGAFAQGAVYKAVVSLQPKSGFAFASFGANAFYHAHAVAVENAIDSTVVTITFPPTRDANTNTNAPTTGVSDGFGWIVAGNGITITGYTGNALTVSIPERIADKPVTRIEDYAFANCTFTGITLPSTLTSIGYGAFFNAAITSISLPAGLTSIEKYAFVYCHDLATITVVAGNTTYRSTDGVLFSDTIYLNADREEISRDTTLVAYPGGKVAGTDNPYAVPNNVTIIGEGAFLGSAALQAVQISSAVNTIEDFAFQNTALVSVSFASRDVSFNGGLNATFPRGDSLKIAYQARTGGIGTYTRDDVDATAWVKQSP